jgi:hypothetical protein
MAYALGLASIDGFTPTRSWTPDCSGVWQVAVTLGISGSADPDLGGVVMIGIGTASRDR